MITTNLTTDILALVADDTQIKKFEALWDIADGVSYNSYLILDEQTALIDTVEKKFSQEFIEAVQEKLAGRRLDYLVINHMEPDHSGTLKQIVELYPDVKIIGNHKTVEFVVGFYQIPASRVQEVVTGDKLSLGNHQLEFLQVPMVHWPESMVTLETTTGILFSNDIFGGFKTVEDQPLADNHQDLEIYLDQARQYFATVLGAHTRPTSRALTQLKNLPIKTIAPAHGLVWQEKRDLIIDHYQKWSLLEADPGVTIVYGSMYGFTQEITQLIADRLQENKIEVSLLNAAETPLSQQLNKIWQYQGLIIAGCTYNNKLFPPVQNLLDALSDRRLQNRLLGIIGSYSWTGGAMRFLTEFAQSSKLELIEPQLEIKFRANEENKKQAEILAKNFIDRLK